MRTQLHWALKRTLRRLARESDRDGQAAAQYMLNASDSSNGVQMAHWQELLEDTKDSLQQTADGQPLRVIANDTAPAGEGLLKRLGDWLWAHRAEILQIALAIFKVAMTAAAVKAPLKESLSEAPPFDVSAKDELTRLQNKYPIGSVWSNRGGRRLVVGHVYDETSSTKCQIICESVTADRYRSVSSEQALVDYQRLPGYVAV